MLRIRSASLREKIKKIFPNFDFGKQRSIGEIKAIRNIVEKVLTIQKDAEMMASTIERGIYPGVTLEDENGRKAVVNKIYCNGHVSLKGRRGGFNPKYWQVVKE